jgi:hypothetical protein
MLGVAYFSITIVLLHFEPTGYDPVSQFVSDYAVGAFALEMSLGFFVGGIGVTGLGLALVMVQTDRRAFRAGAFMTVIVGLVMFLIAGFPTDIEGAASTIHGMVHSRLSAVVFTLGPASMVLISYAQGRRWFGVALSVLAASFVFSALTGVFVLGANGLAERFFIAVLFGWWMVAAYRALREPCGAGGNAEGFSPRESLLRHLDNHLLHLSTILRAENPPAQRTYDRRSSRQLCNSVAGEGQGKQEHFDERTGHPPRWS